MLCPQGIIMNNHTQQETLAELRALREDIKELISVARQMLHEIALHNVRRSQAMVPPLDPNSQER